MTSMTIYMATAETCVRELCVVCHQLRARLEQFHIEGNDDGAIAVEHRINAVESAIMDLS